jgi:hypothetical protein
MSLIWSRSVLETFQWGRLDQCCIEDPRFEVLGAVVDYGCDLIQISESRLSSN